jgi:MFS family permease
MYTGVAVGPALGGLLIRSTGNILSVFYFACILHGIYAIFILLILPESLTRARARGARLRWRQEKAKQASSGRAGLLKSIAGFFSPLVVLLPEKCSANPLKQRGRDWSLFLIAIAYGLSTSIIVSAATIYL